MTVQRDRKLGWGFWLKWVVANSLGVTLSLGITLFILVLNLTPTSMRYQPFASGCFALWALFSLPAVVGLSQQLILRRYGTWSKRWIWVTIGGWVMGYFTAMLFVFLSSVTISSYLILIIIAVTSFGLTVGIAQVILLRQYVHQSVWWVIADVISFVIGAGTLLILSQMTAYDSFLGGFLVGTIGSALTFSIITGLAMMWLLNHPKQSVQLAATVTLSGSQDIR